MLNTSYATPNFYSIFHLSPKVNLEQALYLFNDILDCFFTWVIFPCSQVYSQVIAVVENNLLLPWLSDFLAIFLIAELWVEGWEPDIHKDDSSKCHFPLHVTSWMDFANEISFFFHHKFTSKSLVVVPVHLWKDLNWQWCTYVHSLFPLK